MKERLLWGVDLGGTKIEAVVVKANAPSIGLARHRIDTESSGGYRHIIGRIQGLVAEVERLAGARCERLGVGTPGTIDPGKDALKNSNTLCLNGQPLHRDLAGALGLPVSLMNDANCFALAEAKFGAGRDAGVVFGVILGTGVGGGVVVNGTALTGAHGIAGEWGHNVLDPLGGACYCGKRGCVERVLSGPALTEFYNARVGRQRTLKEIFADQEDPIARETCERLLNGLGQALAVVINIIDPDCIVLGGGVSNFERIYSEIQDRIRPWIFNHEVRTPILKAQLGDSAGVFGAALLSG
jgi:fructokinase